MAIELILTLMGVYLLLCLLLFHLGKDKKIGSFRLMVISLLATPITGFIVLYFSQSRMIVLETRYLCSECRFEFTDSYEYCPHCERSGKQIKLNPVKRNMV